MNPGAVAVEVCCVLYYKYLEMIDLTVKANLRCTDVCLFSRRVTQSYLRRLI